jgi:hypothetical protein
MKNSTATQKIPPHHLAFLSVDTESDIDNLNFFLTTIAFVFVSASWTKVHILFGKKYQTTKPHIFSEGCSCSRRWEG